nr:T-complex protein 1 subunit theta-like [Tanacetum cinerariifolium]
MSPEKISIRAFPFDVSRATCHPGNISLGTSRPGFPGIVAGENGKCYSDMFGKRIRAYGDVHVLVIAGGVDTTATETNLIHKVLCMDSRIVPGAGATEIETARRLKEFACKETRSSDQIVIAKHAESFKLIPKTLAQNANLNVDGIIETLYVDHAAGNFKVGIDLKNGDCKDASTLNIWDIYTTKYMIAVVDIIVESYTTRIRQNM